MQAWIDFAMGPLFALSLGVMALGLLRHLVLQLDTLFRRKRSRLKYMPWNKMLHDSLEWALPVRHLTSGNVTFSNASFVFHIGAILVPLFYAGHIVLWEQWLGINLWSIGNGFADVLTVITILAVLVLLVSRIAVPRLRAISRNSDVSLLVLILLPFISGFLAAHPAFNPLPWQTMFLIHLLSAEALLILVPFTKLSHIVLIFFDRISEIHWQLRPGAGDRVAETVLGKEAKV